MIPLIWKELRENLKWALLALVMLGLAELYALSPSNNDDLYDMDGITLTKAPFLSVTTFGCAATGFILGLIQILPELKRDRWAALLHRPVTRGLIFRSKAITGIFLYVFATVTPFLFMTWLAATPGHFKSPFVPELVLPGTADIVMGASYYFAALLVALQSGGWIGLRALPLMAAIFTSYFVLDQHLFYVAVEAAVLMGLALFTAAWGAIHEQNLIARRPWLGRFAFLAVVFYGVCGCTQLVKVFVNSMFPGDRSNFDRYELSDQGTPLHITYSGNGTTLSVRDVDGKPLTDPHYQPNRIQNHLRYMNGFSLYVGDSHGYRYHPYDAGYRQARTYMWANNPYMEPRMEQWFTLVKDNYLVGFLPAQKRAFSILDRRGFEPPDAKPEGFPPDVNMGYADSSAYCIYSPTRVQYAFLARREIIDLPNLPPPPYYGVGTAFASTPHGTSVNVFGVTTGSGIMIYDTKGVPVTLVPFHHDMDHWGNLTLGINATLDRFYLRYSPSAWIDHKIKMTMPEFIEEMNRQGQVIHAYTLPPLPDSPPNPRTWSGFLSSRLQSPGYYFGMMIYKKVGALLGVTRMQRDLGGQFGHDLPETERISATITALSLIGAGVAFFLARRAYFAPRRAWAWTLFAFAFGPAGLITFLLAADWPVMVACPSCGRRRPVASTHCPACSAAWPAPPVSGIEIIDRPVAATMEGARA